MAVRSAEICIGFQVHLCEVILEIQNVDEDVAQLKKFPKFLRR